ncbi:hypothetical protein B0T14DRAFT_337986 [Immersiella caudata]|uniref:Uncharacterized protein n=1 Tax=Immersiella caudata TaxID=314043 RepID=A0AA39WC60_9PEZI|nr:hypothetical protein B0T14DRAFT_337986 [Immersiella caudata]
MDAPNKECNEAHTTGTFSYMKWNNELYETESPFQILIEIPKDAPDQRTTNVEFETGPPETIADVRATLDSWSLDQHGFKYFPMNIGLSAKKFSDQAFVKEKYLPQCASLIKKALPGAERVHFFGWRLRSSGDGLSPGSALVGKFQKPASVPHVDQTPGAVYDLVSERFPNEAARLFRGRVRTIIVWRPLTGPVGDWPLAVAEASTVPPSCLVECQRIRPKYRGDVFYMLPQEGVKWHYLSRQRSDEALVMKIFDNKEGVAGYCAHASFKLPDAPHDPRPRESIEVRAMVFGGE